MVSFLKLSLFGLLVFALPATSTGEIITKLPVQEKIVALTFDACETRTPSYLDRKISDFLVNRRIPATIFVSGKFTERNRDGLLELSKHNFIEVENHSLNHRQHMERLSREEVRSEVLENEGVILGITGVRPRFFRFPAGNFSNEALREVESLGCQVVHWSFESGDPVKQLSSERLCEWVLSKTKPGSILIFHINGRGYRTGEALPRIVGELEKRGYGFVKLSDVLPQKKQESLSPAFDEESARECEPR